MLANVPLWKQDYIAALAQDLYAGFKLPQQFSSWNCDVNQISESQAAAGTNMCRSNCGVCFLVSGPSGSAVFYGNEIADYGAVGQNGQGIDLHLYNGGTGHISEVRTWSGVSKDISVKRVPCPVGNTGMQIYWYANYDTNSISDSSSAYLVVLNHRTQVKSLRVRAAEGTGGDQSWKPLVADWTNRWHYETYGNCKTCPSWQQGWGGITRGSSAKQFELEVTDIFGAAVVCRNLTSTVADTIVNCQSIAGATLQLPIPEIAISPCDGSDYSTVANIDLYSSAELAFTTNSGSTGAASSTAATSSTAAASSTASTSAGHSTTATSTKATTSTTTKTHTSSGSMVVATYSLILSLFFSFFFF